MTCWSSDSISSSMECSLWKSHWHRLLLTECVQCAGSHWYWEVCMYQRYSTCLMCAMCRLLYGPEVQRLSHVCNVQASVWPRGTAPVSCVQCAGFCMAQRYSACLMCAVCRLLYGPEVQRLSHVCNVQASVWPRGTALVSCVGDPDIAFPFSSMESCHWFENWYCGGCCASCLALMGERKDWLAQCQYTVTEKTSLIISFDLSVATGKLPMQFYHWGTLSLLLGHQTANIQTNKQTFGPKDNELLGCLHSSCMGSQRRLQIFALNHVSLA